MAERETVPPMRQSGNKTVLVLFGLGLLILAIGVIVLWSKHAPDPPPPERPVVEPIAMPPPLVMLPSERPVTPEPDAAPPGDVDTAGPEPAKRGSIYGVKQGTIDAAVTNKFINSHFSQVRSCYERRLKMNPMLEGALDLKIRLTPKGKVGSVGVNSDTVHDSEMLDCVRRTIRGWQFPAPVDGWAVFDKSFKFKKKG
jgi:hypothetical protein